MKNYSFLLSLMFLSLVYGCGKGGSDPTDTNSSTLHGIANKGIVVNGQIDLFSIDDQGHVSTHALASTRTGSDGRFSLNIPRQKQALLVTVRPAADGSSRTKCDNRPSCSSQGTTVPFGELQEMNFNLSSIIDSTDQETLQVSLSPLTTLATGYAQNLGMSPENIRHAQEKVQNLFGLADLNKLQPVDITRKDIVEDINVLPEQLKHGYLSAAIAKLAEEAFEGDISKTLNNLVNTYNNQGGELFARIGNQNLQDDIALLPIIQAAVLSYQQNEEANFSNNALVLTQLQRQLSLLENRAPGSITMTATELSNDELHQAKELLTQFRSWYPVIRDQLNTAKQDSTFYQNLQTLNNIDQNQIALLSLVNMSSIIALTRFVHEQSLSSAGLQNGEFSIAPYLPKRDDGLGFYANSYGNIIVEGKKIRLSKTNISIRVPHPDKHSPYAELYFYMGSAFVSLGIELPQSVTGNELEVRLLENSLIQTAALDMTYSNGSVLLGIEEGMDWRDYSFSHPPKLVSVQAQITIEPRPEIIHNSQATRFHGLLTMDNVVFKAPAPCEPSLYYCPALNTPIPLPSHISMSGWFEDAANSFYANLSLNMSNTESFDPNLAESQDNWANINTSIDFLAQFANLPEARVEVRLDRIDLDAGIAEIIFTYDRYQILLRGLISQQYASDYSLTVTHTDPLINDRFSFHYQADSATATGNIIVNNRIVGEVSYIGNRHNVVLMVYPDGSFESINL